MNSDTIAVNKCLMDDLLKNGIDKVSKSHKITEKSKKGREMLTILKSGQDIIDKKNDPIHVTELLLNLLHFREYTHMFEKVFNEWDNPMFEETNSKLSEQFYINAARDVRDMHELVSDELFEITVLDLLYIKSNYDETKMEKIYDVCMKLVAKEWVESGLIKQKL